MATFKTVVNEEDGGTDFYIDGEFQASWHKAAQIPTPLTTAMKALLEQAFEAGRRDRSAEFKKLLGL